jgi:hypothetical protein
MGVLLAVCVKVVAEKATTGIQGESGFSVGTRVRSVHDTERLTTDRYAVLSIRFVVLLYVVEAKR